MTEEELENLLAPGAFTGLAPAQVTSFLENEVKPVLNRYADILAEEVEIQF